MGKRIVIHAVLGMVIAVMLIQQLLYIQRDIRPLLMLLLAAAILLVKSKLLGPFLAGFICGLLVVPLHLSGVAEIEKQLLTATQIRGTVISHSGMKQSSIINVEGLLTERGWTESKAKVILYRSPEVEIGDQVVVKGTFEEIRGAVNPYGFDSRQYYGAKGIRGVFIGASKGLVSREASKSILSYLLNARQHWIERIEDASTYGGYWVAFILGNDEAISEDAVSLIRRTGLAHVLAVSGLHVGIIYGCLVFFSRLLLKERRKRDAMIIISLLVYLVLNLFSFTVLRAVLLLIYHRWSFYASRRPDVLTAIGWIAGVNVICNPYCLFDLSFILSLGAAVSIALLYRPFKRLLKPLGDTLSSQLGIILAAQVGVLPVQLYLFNVFYPESILFNLLFVPVLSLVIALAFVLSAMSFLPLLLPILAMVFDAAMGIVENTLLRGSQVIEFPIHCTGFGIIVAVGGGLLLLSLLQDLKRTEKIALAMLFIGFVIAGGVVNAPDFRILFLSTGKSDAMVIQNKGYTVMIDTADGALDLGTLLLKNDIGRLDALILTHDDLDHIGGYEAIKEKIEIKTVVRGLQGPSELSYADMHLFLDYGEEGMSDNDGSIIVRLEHEGFKMLFMGDAETLREERLVERGFVRDVDGIKVGHHGSNTSSSDRLLAAGHPQIGIILADGSAHFPREEILDRLALCGILVYRTDQSGAIEMTHTTSEIRIKEYLRTDNEL